MKDYNVIQSEIELEPPGNAEMGIYQAKIVWNS